jgi:hypothetical protein
VNSRDGSWNLKHDNEEEKSMPNCRRSDDGDDDENFLQVAVKDQRGTCVGFKDQHRPSCWSLVCLDNVIATNLSCGDILSLQIGEL